MLEPILRSFRPAHCDDSLYMHVRICFASFLRIQPRLFQYDQAQNLVSGAMLRISGTDETKAPQQAGGKFVWLTLVFSR